MGLIKKTVTGIAEDLKLVKNAKNWPLDPKDSGTKRAKFQGSNDTRAAGPVNNERGKYGMKPSPGYIDQAPVEADISLSKKIASDALVKGTGPTATTAKAKYKADNNAPLTKGMGGTVYGPMAKWGND